MNARAVVTTGIVVVFCLAGATVGLGLGAWGGTTGSLVFFSLVGFAVGAMFGAPVAAIVDVLAFRRDMSALGRVAWVAISLLAWIGVPLGALLYFGLGDDKTRRLGTSTAA